jgi:hypothetical protein
MIEIDNITMDGTEKTYNVPANTYSLALHAVGASITMRKVSGSAIGWTIADGEKEAFETRTVAGERIYFIGASGKLEIRRLTGLLS